MLSAAVADSPGDISDPMQHWSKVPLGDVLSFRRGFDLPHRLRRRGDVPIITSSGNEDFHDKSAVSGPGVVTGRYGTIGRVFFVEKDYWPLNTTLYVTDFKGNDPKFIFHFLQTFDFKTHSGKSGVPGVNRNDLHQVAVVFPNRREEQEKIAVALSDADALIESLEALVAKKRAIKQGAMQELLSGQRRLSGFHAQREESTLGVACDSIVDGTHFTPKYVEKGVPFYSVENVTADDFTNTKYISPEEHRILGRVDIQGN